MTIYSLYKTQDRTYPKKVYQPLILYLDFYHITFQIQKVLPFHFTLNACTSVYFYTSENTTLGIFYARRRFSCEPKLMNLPYSQGEVFFTSERHFEFKWSGRVWEKEKCQCFIPKLLGGGSFEHLCTWVGNFKSIDFSPCLRAFLPDWFFVRPVEGRRVTSSLRSCQQGAKQGLNSQEKSLKSRETGGGGRIERWVVDEEMRLQIWKAEKASTYLWNADGEESSVIFSLKV